MGIHADEGNRMYILQNAENGMPTAFDDQQLVSWFNTNPPPGINPEIKDVFNDAFRQISMETLMAILENPEGLEDAIHEIAQRAAETAAQKLEQLKKEGKLKLGCDG